MKQIAASLTIAVFSALALADDMPQNQVVTVFGISLGGPVPYQECPAQKIGTLPPYYPPHSARCWQHAISSEAGSPARDNERITMKFPIAEQRDTVVIASDLHLTLIGGNIEGASWATYGPAAPLAFEKLKEKFGIPKKAEEVDLKNKMGATFKTIYAKWDTGAVEVVFKGLDGTIDRGSVSVRTPALVRHDAETARKAAENTTKL